MLRSPTKKAIVTNAVRPNAGLQAKYRRELDKLIEEMQNSLVYWIRAAYRANQPEIAQDELAGERLSNGNYRCVVSPVLAMDASPAVTLQLIMKRLARRWTKRFNDAAPELAKYFATAAHKRVDGQLQAILKSHGFTVGFKMTPAMNDVMQATIGEQVGLIKSIAAQHLSQVEGLVMRSVQAGGDLATLSNDLQKRLGVSKRRAALIARDQNNKATATLTRVRQDGLGITHAIWMHSHGGKVPRPSHLANDGKKYDIKTGWYDPDEKRFVYPGELINCRCVSKSIIPGF